MLMIHQLLAPYIVRGISCHQSSTMKALEYTAKDKKLKLVKRTIPSVGEDEIKIEVHYAGVCGTDLHIIDGEFPCKQDGLVLGHEFCGIVKEIGENITHVKVGDKVVSDPETCCMTCGYCRRGRPHFCPTGGLNSTFGIFRDGGWAEYVVVPDTQVHKIPESLTLEQASLCEPMSCLAHTWTQISPIPVGSRVLILGAGIIGNLFASMLHLHGHRIVTVSDPNETRLNLAEGLNLCYDMLTPDYLKSCQEHDPDYLFDFVFDASGNPKAMENAFNMMDFGAKLCLFGVANPTLNMSINPFKIFKKELTLMGCVINPFSFPKALSILHAMGDRYISFKKLGVQTFTMEKYEDAISSLRKGAISKATFLPRSQTAC